MVYKFIYNYYIKMSLIDITGGLPKLKTLFCSKTNDIIPVLYIIQCIGIFIVLLIPALVFVGWCRQN